MKTKWVIISCLIVGTVEFCSARTVKIGRFECLQGTRMSIYACGKSPQQWDYIYIDSPWAKPFFIEYQNLDKFLDYTLRAAELYNQWTAELKGMKDVPMCTRHIESITDVLILYYNGHSYYSIEGKYQSAKRMKFSYDFFLNKIGNTFVECNICDTYNNLSFYLDAEGIDDFIYVLQHATERYVNNPNVKAENVLDNLLK